MDLPALLARAPELALIDELAHTNAPGVEHAKRYEDIADLLDAGIDVFSTVNVQHLESLNDQVAELTGVRVRETVPDEVLGRADELVLVDLTPEDLIERLREGKVYPPRARRRPRSTASSGSRTCRRCARSRCARSPRTSARSGWTASRSSCARTGSSRARRRRAENRGAAARARRAGGAGRAHHPPRVALGAAAGAPSSTSSSSASRSGRPAPPSASAWRRCGGWRRCSARTWSSRRATTPAEVVARVARERGTTYVLVAAPPVRRGLGALRTPLPMRIVQALPEVDVRIVADRTRAAR